MVKSDVLDETVTASTENGDHEKLAHYVKKDELLDGLVNGLPVMALCGKIWIPTRDGEKFPQCMTCKEIFATLPLN